MSDNSSSLSAKLICWTKCPARHFLAGTNAGKALFCRQNVRQTFLSTKLLCRAKCRRTRIYRQNSFVGQNAGKKLPLLDNLSRNIKCPTNMLCWLAGPACQARRRCRQNVRQSIRQICRTKCPAKCPTRICFFAGRPSRPGPTALPAKCPTEMSDKIVGRKVRQDVRQNV